MNRKPSKPATKPSRPILAIDQLVKDVQEANKRKEQSQTWDELDEYYRLMGEALVEMAVGIHESVKYMSDNGYRGDNELKLVVSQALKDNEQFTQMLLDIKQRHEGKKGQAKNGDEIAQIMDIMMLYQDIWSKFSKVMFPTVMTITEHVDIVTRSLAELAKQDELTDPTVVSDVEFKEPEAAEVAEEQQTKQGE